MERMSRRAGDVGHAGRSSNENGEAMGFAQVNATIPVDLVVTRFRTFPEDGMVELWGEVGDYEVCVHLPLDDVRLRPLLAQEESQRGTRKQRRT